mmetsp:Transcript_36994/g.6596  ORF Transcript_36994/g.6596 Transcript_36994/m.6596 type:complete len:82 (+) Transcript_36994:629-874(+)
MFLTISNTAGMTVPHYSCTTATFPYFITGSIFTSIILFPIFAASLISCYGKAAVSCDPSTIIASASPTATAADSDLYVSSS